MSRWLASVLSLAAASAIAPGLYGMLMPSASIPPPPPVQIRAEVIAPSAPRYALPVVEVAEHPPKLIAAWEASQVTGELEETVRPLRDPGQCPVELRAIVAGGEPDGFAMVAMDGESTLVRRGDRFRTALGAAKVAFLSNTHMTLTGGFGKRRCALDSER